MAIEALTPSEPTLMENVGKEMPSPEVVPEPKAEPTFETDELKIFESFSPDAGQLALALSKAQGAMSNAAKDKEGYGYQYATLSGIVEIARKPLSDNELAIFQSHQLVRGSTPSVITRTTLMHSSGQWYKSSLQLPIHVMNNLSQAQMIGSIITYSKRYQLQSLFMIASADEDNDAAK